MPTKETETDAFEALLEDAAISFNVARSSRPSSRFSRKVILLHPNGTGPTIIPGIKLKAERDLVGELRSIQNWKIVLKFAFGIHPNTFSFLWRFTPDWSKVLKMVSGVTPLKPDAAQKIRRSYAKYRAWLKSYLTSGTIYRLPDKAIDFRNPDRHRHPYARGVLVLDVRSDQLVMIPFSTQIHRIRKKFDILFDPKGREDLTEDASPAVESFPYGIFDRKVMLCIWYAQSMTERQFLDEALVRVGSVRRELLDIIRERMKKMAPITFKHE